MGSLLIVGGEAAVHFQGGPNVFTVADSYHTAGHTAHVMDIRNLEDADPAIVAEDIGEAIEGIRPDGLVLVNAAGRYAGGLLCTNYVTPSGREVLQTAVDSGIRFIALSHDMPKRPSRMAGFLRARGVHTLGGQVPRLDFTIQGETE